MTLDFKNFERTYLVLVNGKPVLQKTAYRNYYLFGKLAHSMFVHVQPLYGSKLIQSFSLLYNVKISLIVDVIVAMKYPRNHIFGNNSYFGFLAFAEVNISILCY